MIIDEKLPSNMSIEDLITFLNDWYSSDAPRLAAKMLAKLKYENDALKAFVKPILVHGGDGVGEWDGYELQELAVKSGLFISKIMTEPCNLGNEEKMGCLCQEYCYGDESWECYQIVKFLLEDDNEQTSNI